MLYRVSFLIFLLNVWSSAQGSIEITRTDILPKIDGVMSPDEWAAAKRIEITSQIEPVSGATGSERTEAYLMYDKENLYVAFRAFDSDPSGIRAPVSKRDNVSSGDDFVAVWLDTFDDRRRAYGFRFNPLGIQEDGIFSEGERSLAWDGVYESKGTIDAEGYTVEARIPFKTLRFQINEKKKWGLHLFRSIARKKEDISWMPISRAIPNIFLQMGELRGLDGVFAGRTLELIPTVVASNTGTRESDPTVPGGARLNTVNRVEPGLTAIYQLTPNLTLSATVNPDFSQIEADAPQVTVNQRFPLFFDEKRTFFLEGAEVFRPLYSAAQRIVDTRQIVDPDWGLKLTGKVGNNTIGVLSASDNAPGLRIQPSDPNFGKNALYNIFRYARDLKKNTTFGFTLTDRRFAGSSNTVGVADGRIRFGGGSHLFSYQLAYSKTKDTNGEKREGGQAYFVYNFDNGKWDVTTSQSGMARNFAAQTGFIRRTGFLRSYYVVGHSFRPQEKSWWVKVRPFVVALAFKNSEGKLDESFFDPGVDMIFARGISLYTYVSLRKDNFAGRDLPSRSYNARWTFDRFQRFSASGDIEIGTDANFDPARPEVGKLLSNELSFTIKPISRLNSEFLWLKNSLKSRRDNARLFAQDILRNRTIYQFNGSNAVRSIVEYDTSQRRLGVSFVYSFTPSPNKALYIGYNDLLYNGLEPLTQTRQAGLFRQSRGLFAKVSYNFRF